MIGPQLMKPHLLTLLILLLNNPLAIWTATSSTVGNPGRICVTSDVDCSQLLQKTGRILDCVTTRDRLDCLKRIQNGRADFGYFEAEDLNLAASIASENENFDYAASLEFSSGKEVRSVYLLINNGSNTRPSTLCHPGFNRQRLYPKAFHSPTTLDSIDSSADIQDLIISLSESWKSACVPGPWSPDPITDRQLKRDHPHLCNSCLRKNCDLDDPYAGQGAIQCLLDHSAEAAFVSDIDFRDIRSKNVDVENLYHLCRNKDDPIQPLRSRTGPSSEPCDWGQRPLPVLLSRVCANDECKNRHQILEKALTSHDSLLKGVLNLPRSVQVMVKNKVMSPVEILKEAGYNVNQEATLKERVTICIKTKAGMDKCSDLVKAWQAYNNPGGIGIKCLLSEDPSGCYSSVYFGNADVITLDGGDVYQATLDYGFERILSEIYNEAATTPTSSYYAVAVIRAESNITSFSHLKGKKSCHTGIDKTAGWKIPVATLLEQNLIEPLHCNYVNAMAEFFNGGSCAPGGRSIKYNKQQNYVEQLCALCQGQNDDKCARNNEEPFYSDAGAFRCLVHGGGDVAFVKDTTVPSLTTGSTSESWAIGLHPEQFRLLCPSGGTAHIKDYRACNLALVPADESVVSGRMSSHRKTMVRETLLGISNIFNPDAPGSKTFRLFGSYQGHPDLIFRDSAFTLRSLSEDSQEEIQMKKKYFRQLKELHSCEVRVCALEEKISDCQEMAQTMLSEGHQFVCVSARDRMDCVNRVIRGQVDMSPLPGSFMGFNPDLRIFAFMRDPAHSQDAFRSKAVMVVRRSTIKRLSDLRGKKSCHAGYGDMAGWQIPLAMLKRHEILQPLCGLGYQSTVETEISSLSVTFNRACVPGKWAVSATTDSALKRRYKAMCSICRSRTCDSEDDYAGYDGTLRCLTENGGDVAFTKLSAVKDFFEVSHGVNSSAYGLLCPDGRLVNVDSIDAEYCHWASIPWDAYVTHSGNSDAKVFRMFWSLTQAKRKGEEDMAKHAWYFSTLGIGDYTDILPVVDKISTGQYYSQSNMATVSQERLCQEKAAIRFCVTSDEEERKCNSLSSLLTLKGVTPPLSCVRGNDIIDCTYRISTEQADITSMTDVQRHRANNQYNLVNLMTENYGAAGSTLSYLVAVVKNSSNINSISDLPGKVTCNSAQNATEAGIIDYTLTQCLSGTNSFFKTFRDAITCLTASNRDVAFLKVPNSAVSTYIDPDEFQLLCSSGTMPINSANIQNCYLGKVPADVIVTRQTESSAKKQDMMYILQEASKGFGKPDSFFRLFFEYFNHRDLLFKDKTTDLTPLEEDQYQMFIALMWQQACHLYEHHLKSVSPLN